MGDASAKPSPRLLLLMSIGTLLAMLVISLLLTLFVHRLRESADWVRHTQEVVLQALRVQKLSVDMETGLRGFQISRDTQFLEPYNEAGAVIRSEIDRLEQLVRVNPLQAERAADIQRALAKWNQYASEALQQAKAGEEVRDVVMNARGKALMDDVRQEIGWFLEQEDLLEDVRRQELAQLKQNAAMCRTGLFVVAGLGIAFFLFAWLRPTFRPPDTSSPVLESSKA